MLQGGVPKNHGFCVGAGGNPQLSQTFWLAREETRKHAPGIPAALAPAPKISIFPTFKMLSCPTCVLSVDSDVQALQQETPRTMESMKTIMTCRKESQQCSVEMPCNFSPMKPTSQVVHRAGTLNKRMEKEYRNLLQRLAYVMWEARKILRPQPLYYLQLSVVY